VHFGFQRDGKPFLLICNSVLMGNRTPRVRQVGRSALAALLMTPALLVAQAPGSHSTLPGEPRGTDLPWSIAESALNSEAVWGSARLSSEPRQPQGQSTTLRIPDGQVLLFTARAEGVQVYTSQAKATDAAAFEWVLKGPDAILFDSSGAKIGKHYGGPTWESTDGSKVKGSRLAGAPPRQPGDIPWLLLKTASSEGVGVMSGVTYVLRVDTRGGIPAVAPRRAGQEIRVKYRATYIFLGAAPVG
jgi:hypothetical protein